jgi:methylmalonyl-CoA/ethylmalonyl-CoA epimerase
MARNDGAARELHHVGIVVADLEEAAAGLLARHGIEVRLFPESVYRCRIAGREEAPVTRIGLSVGPPPHVELLRAVPGSDIWRAGPGVHHLGYVVRDLPGEAARLAATGAPVVMAGLRDGAHPSGATYHRDPLGHLVELLDEVTAARLAARLAGT